MYCSNCSQELQDGANFCHQCGFAIRIINEVNSAFGTHVYNLSYYLEKIPCKYDKIEDLTLQFVRVWNNNKMGIIDDKGFEVFPCVYDNYDFLKRGGLIRVWNNNKIGIVNNTGNIILPCSYDSIEILNDYYEVLKVSINNKSGLFDFQGEEIFSCEFDEFNYIGDGLVEIVNESKKGLTSAHGYFPCKYDKIYRFDKNGIAKVKLSTKYGLITKKNIITDCIFDSISRFYDQIARVTVNNQWGIINELGECIITPKYDWIAEFYNGRACVIKNGKWGLIDKNGKEIEPCVNRMIWNFTRGVIIFRNSIVTTHQTIRGYGPDIDGYFYNELNHGYTRTSKRDKTGETVFERIEKDGLIIKECFSKPEFNAIKEGFDGIIAAESNGKWGFTDTDGNVILPFEYEMVYSRLQFDDLGIKIVKKAGLWGAIDRRGISIIPFMYEAIEIRRNKSFRDEIYSNIEFFDFKGNAISPHDLLAAKFEGKWGFIDACGNVIIPFAYDDCLSWTYYGTMNVKKGERWGLINQKNEVLVPFIHITPNDEVFKLVAIKTSEIIIEQANKIDLIDNKNLLFYK